MTERRIPTWCSKICRNAWNEKCVEECSVNRDCSYFEENPGTTLEDMGPPPEKEEVKTAAEKYTATQFWQRKMYERLTGKEIPVYGRTVSPRQRRHLDGAANGKETENCTEYGLSVGPTESSTVNKDQGNPESMEVRRDEIVRRDE